MTREDRFVRILGEVESGNNPEAWGDHGRAAGRFQWHPRTLAMYLPLLHDRLSESPTWDEVFEVAVRWFHQKLSLLNPEKTDAQIAMAYHLHGFAKFTGWDTAYAARWDHCAANVDAKLEQA